MTIHKIETPNSSAISHAEWHEATRDLTVRFRKGSSATYRDVPAVVFDDLRRAPSVGEFINRRIKAHYRQGL